MTASVCEARKQRWYREASLSQAEVPHRGFDRQPLDIHVGERGGRQRSNNIPTGNWPLHAVEFIRPDYYDGVPAVQSDTLRPSLLGLSHHLAQAGLCVLKAPTVTGRRPAGLFWPFHFPDCPGGSFSQCNWPQGAGVRVKVKESLCSVAPPVAVAAV
jgi:hypothetical protein